jgi:hypothetical protein
MIRPSMRISMLSYSQIDTLVLCQRELKNEVFLIAQFHPILVEGF